MCIMYYFRYPLYLIVILCFSSAAAGSYEDFFRAIEVDDARALTALLGRGFDPNARDEMGQVGLFLALRGGSVGATDVLIRHPQLHPDALNQAGETALMMAALRGNLSAAMRLLGRGSKVHQDGWSPIHYAATGPEARIVELLLNRGAPVDARSPNGTTPLMMAARNGTEAGVRLLLGHGADRRLRNDQGLAAADFARMDGRDHLAAELDSGSR